MIRPRFWKGFFPAVALWLLCGVAAAEIICFKNGDVIHGTLVGMEEDRITLSTSYGRLTIPREDILRIEYEGGEATPSGARPDWGPSPSLASVVSFEIRGRSFWYAFESPPDNPIELTIRLRLFLGEMEVATLLDSKPDTVDKNSFYNSFTFSPTDSEILKTAEGFDCRVEKAEDGRVVMQLDLPEGHASGQHMVRMLYQINEGSRSLPRWADVVSRSFPIETEAGKESYVILEQNASGVEYSGFFRRSMKNLETFQVSVVSAELRELQEEP